jgi:aspartate aminotransferase-like enzyme
MLKKRLFTPGPTSVPEQVLLEMAEPIMHHRTEEFIKIAAETLENLKYVFCTKNDVFVIASSGTGAMEASVVNFLSAGDKVVVISGGKFGERFREICLAYKLEVIPIEMEWGKKLSPETVKDVLTKNKGVKAVFGTLCETSTGTHFDVEGIAKVVAGFEDTIFVVDAVSSLGAVPCLTDEWKIDIVVTGSQKALMLPPGLAFMSVSEKAWKKAETSGLPKYYLNLKKYKKAIAKSDFPFTIPVSLVAGLRKSLEMLKNAGIEKVWEEHRKRAEATRQAFLATGLKLFSESPSDAVTAVLLPEGVDGDKLVKSLRAKYGISVAGGQDHMKGKIIRISHLGWQDEFDVLTAVTAVGVGLKQAGCPVDIEKGVSVIQNLLF